MGRFTRVQVWDTMEKSGIVPLYYHEDIETAKRIAEALIKGGAGIIEFANRGRRAFEIYREVALHLEQHAPTVIFGVGSVLDTPTAGLYINLGANFIVSPATHADVAKLCNRRKVAYIPGCATATEISLAEELGVEICKVFPASALGGPDFIRSIKGPCPHSKLMPTGGVDATQENLQDWFDAGVACVGIGSALVRTNLVEAGDWDGISALTKHCLDWIAKIRATS